MQPRFTFQLCRLSVVRLKTSYLTSLASVCLSVKWRIILVPAQMGCEEQMNPHRYSVCKCSASLVCTIISYPTSPGQAWGLLHFILTVLAHGRSSELPHLPNAWKQSALDLGLSDQRVQGKTPIPVLAVTLPHCVALNMLPPLPEPQFPHE